MSDNSTNPNTTELELKRKIEELNQLSRVVGNGIAYLNDQDVKIAYIQPVGEFLAFLTGFRQNVQQQKSALEAMLPKQEEAKTVEAQPLEVK